MYEKDFARRLSIHWCDLDKHEIVEAVGPENIAGSGLVEEADLTAAVAHVMELEGQLLRAIDAESGVMRLRRVRDSWRRKSAAAYRRGLTDAAGIVASKAKEYTLKADQYWRDDKRTLARDFDAYAVAALHCIAAIRRAGGGQ